MNICLESPYSATLQEDIDQIAVYISTLKLKDVTFLVTGGTGLIGSLIFKSLLCCNRKYNTRFKIILLVRNQKKALKQFGDLLSSDLITLIEKDITERIDLKFSVDYIIHCASPTKSKYFVENPVETIQTIVSGTDTILKLGKEKAVSGIIYLSSMEIYGRYNNLRTNLKIREDNLGNLDLLDVRSSYPESKRLVECLCFSYAKEYNLPVKIVRLAQTFGPGISKDESRVFAQLAKSIINKTDFCLHTTGNSVGNYCYSVDAIKAIFLILIKGKMGETYTVVNEDASCSINEMVNMVLNKIGKGQTKLVYDIPDSNTTFGYAPDSNMFLSAYKLSLLGWHAETELETMFVRLIRSLLELEDNDC